MPFSHYTQVDVHWKTSMFEDPIFIRADQCPGPPAWGACEFCPGPCQTSTLTILEYKTMKMREMTYEEAKEKYKGVVGRDARIAYWVVLREMKREEEDAKFEATA